MSTYKLNVFYQLPDSLSAVGVSLPLGTADAPRTETLRERHIFDLDRTVAEHLDEFDG